MTPILAAAHTFFTDLTRHLSAANINVSTFPISHLCYRVATLAEYESTRDELKSAASEFVENNFNGRPVSMLILKTPLALSATHRASLIELPSPRDAHIYPTGLEHCGFDVGPTLPAFNARHAGALTGHKDRGPGCKPSFITFPNGHTAKFYDRPLREIVELDGWKFSPP